MVHFFSRVKKISKIFSKFGANESLKLLTYYYSDMGTVEVPIKGIKHPVYLRSKTTDFRVLTQIFAFDDYHLNIKNIDLNFIIDAGANVGYAAVYFSNKYPDATIYSIDPETSNFEMLEKNTSKYSQILPINAGLWNEDAYLKISNPTDDHWGFQVEKVDDPAESSFKAVTVGSLMEQAAADSIDILKMDIEGAEKDVFTSNYESWLPKVKVMIVELHGQGARDAFYNAVKDENFVKFEQGENLVCIRPAGRTEQPCG